MLRTKHILAAYTSALGAGWLVIWILLGAQFAESIGQVFVVLFVITAPGLAATVLMSSRLSVTVAFVGGLMMAASVIPSFIVVLLLGRAVELHQGPASLVGIVSFLCVQFLAAWLGLNLLLLLKRLVQALAAVIRP